MGGVWGRSVGDRASAPRGLLGTVSCMPAYEEGCTSVRACGAVCHAVSLCILMVMPQNVLDLERRACAVWYVPRACACAPAPLGLGGAETCRL